MAILLIIRHLLFIAFFVRTWIWRVSLLPLVVWVGLMLYASPKKEEESWWMWFKDFLHEHTITLSWMMIMIWLWWFLDVLMDSSLMIWLWLVLLNLLLRIWSYLSSYKDGQQVFHYWWYFSSILLFVSLARLTSHEFLLEVMLWWMSLTMAIYAFLIFVLGSVWLVKDRSLHYPLFITFNCCILYLIYYYTQQNVGLSLVVAQWYLLGLYALIRRIMQWKEQPHLTYDDSNDLFKHILSWQTITRFKKKITGGPVELINDIQWFLDSIPSKRKSIFGLFNILLVVGQIGLFVFRMKQWIVSLDQLWFWLWIGFFFMSFILLRSIWFAYKLQRIMAFIVINVALYLSIIALFGNNVVYIVWSWIIWTIVNSLLIFHHKTFDRRWVLTDDDVFYWIWGTTITTLCNLYFMMLLPLSLQLVFSIILLYLGIQVFLIRYNLVSIWKIK